MPVTPVTTSSSAARQQPVNAVAADISAAVCAASAGVHAALVMPHAEESARMASAFVVATVALSVAAVVQTIRPGQTAAVATAGLLLAVVTAYVLSRTTGIPGLTDQPEPFDALGIVVTSLEVAAAVVMVRPLIRRRTS